MANEITIGVNLSFSKSGTSESFKVASATDTMAGTDYVKGTQQVPTTPGAALGLGGITTPGYLMIVNNDSSNPVDIKNGTGGAVVARVDPGMPAAFQLATTTPWVMATGGVVEIEYLLIEA